MVYILLYKWTEGTGEDTNVQNILLKTMAFINVLISAWCIKYSPLSSRILICIYIKVKIYYIIQKLKFCYTIVFLFVYNCKEYISTVSNALYGAHQWYFINCICFFYLLCCFEWNRMIIFAHASNIKVY